MAFSLTRPWILALASFEMAWADPCRSCALSQRRRRDQTPSPRLYYGNASRAYPSIPELTKIRYPSIIPNSSQAVLETPLQPLKIHSPSSTNCYTIQSSLLESQTQTTNGSFPHSICPRATLQHHLLFSRTKIPAFDWAQLEEIKSCPAERLALREVYTQASQLAKIYTEMRLVVSNQEEQSLNSSTTPFELDLHTQCCRTRLLIIS